MRALRFFLARRLWRLAAWVEPEVYALGQRLVSGAELLAPSGTLRRGDTVAVHLVTGDEPRERRLRGVLKALGNLSGPLVVAVDTTEVVETGGEQ